MPNNDPQHTGCDPCRPASPGRHDRRQHADRGVPGGSGLRACEERQGPPGDHGFDGPTGVAVGDHGELYVSEVLHGAPQTDGPPPPGFDPSTGGRIVKVGWYGERECAAVTMPTGLDFEDGKLYASAWSIAGFLGIQDAGQVVQVGRRAFRDCVGAPTPPPGPPGAPNGPSTPPEGPPAPPTNGDPTPPADGPPAPPTNGDRPRPPMVRRHRPPTGIPPRPPTVRRHRPQVAAGRAHRWSAGTAHGWPAGVPPTVSRHRWRRGDQLSLRNGPPSRSGAPGDLPRSAGAPIGAPGVPPVTHRAGTGVW